MNTILINLFGSPGTGKSTTAAELFALMKHKGMSVELVREYAKDIVWQGNIDLLTNQLHIVAEQNDRVYRLLGRVEYIITDSPILLSNVYNTGTDTASQALNGLVSELHHKDKSINIFLNRTKAYDPKGRTQTEDEANELTNTIRSLLEQHEGLNYLNLNALPRVANQILKGLL